MSRRDDQPQAAPYKGRAGVAGRNRPAWMGSGERRLHWRSQLGKGGASFPRKQGKKNWRMNAEFSVKKRKPFNMKYKSIGFYKTV
jgi:hypothetical protein